jgi:Mce-associated membrane protein
MSVSLYDLLDVERDASDAEIRAAWKSAIADHDPSDRRFRAYNQAAEVLLDPSKRAAYDAEIATDGTAPAPATPEAADDYGPPPPIAAERETPGVVTQLRRRLARPSRSSAQTPTGTSTGTSAGPRGWTPPGWLLVGLLVVTLVLAGTAAWLVRAAPSDTSVERALRTAEAVAQTAVPRVFSYDYRHLDEDHDKAAAYLTDSYRTEKGGYDDTFDSVIKTNAPELKAVVEAQFISSGVIRTGGGAEADDRVEVMVVFDQVTTNRQFTEPRRSPAYAVVTMERVGDDWLIDDVEGPQVPQ